MRINRTEFRRVIALARTVDPALSVEERDYLLDNFRLKNEIAGDGQVGLNLIDFSLRVLHPDWVQ